jgi:hypothetical protein
VLDLAEKLFRAIYPDHAREYSRITEALMTSKVLSDEVLEDVLGVSVSETSKKHLFRKATEPDFEVPSSRLIDLNDVASSPFSRALAFMVMHCTGHQFTRIFQVIPEASLTDLVTMMENEGDDRSEGMAAILCMLAQAVEDEGVVEVKDFGVDIDRIWNLFPFTPRGRYAPLGATTARQIIDLKCTLRSIHGCLNAGSRFSKPGKFEHQWQDFVRVVWEKIEARVNALKDQLRHKIYEKITPEEMQLLDMH